MFEMLKNNNFNFGLTNSSGRGASKEEIKVQYLWRKALADSQDLRTKMAAAKKWTDKAKVRAEWASAEHKAWDKTSGKVKEDSNIKSEDKQGTWLSLPRIAWKEGGGAVGLKAALRYCTACLMMGDEWFEWCSMAGVMRYKYVVRTQNDRWTSAWRSFTKWRRQPSGAATTEKPRGAATTEKLGEETGTTGNGNANGGTPNKPDEQPPNVTPKPKVKTPEWKTQINQETC
jgi:hypothetical protein